MSKTFKIIILSLLGIVAVVVIVFTVHMISSGGNIFGETLADRNRKIENERRQKIETLLPAANKGDMNAQKRLASYYYTLKEYDNSFLWLKRAASQKDREAYYRLAHYYQCGIGIKMNMAEAIRLYTLSAEQDFTEAMFALSVLETDKQKSKYWSDKVKESLKGCPGCDIQWEECH